MSSSVFVIKNLGDICDITVGFPFPSAEFNLLGDGIRLLRGMNISRGYLRWEHETRWWKGSSEIVDRYSLCNRDVVISMDGSLVGKNYALISTEDLPLLLVQRVARLRAKTGFSQDFLYYLVANERFESYIDSVKTGTSIPHISAKQIANYEVLVPDELSQVLISKILGSIDRKIKINNKINKTLEEMAQAIFKSWFVDFEPFKEDDFCESEFGRLPMGWNVSSIKEIIDIYDNKRIPLSKNQRDKMVKVYPYYGASSQMDYVEDYLFDGLYVLLGEDGTVVDELGYPILQYVWGKFWVNNHAHILQGKNGFDTNSLFLFLKNTNVSSIVTGAVQAKISQSALFSIKVIIPKMEVIQEFNNIIGPLFIKLRSNVDENKVLEKMRDSLLPKLMSGEIQVPLEEVPNA